MSCKGWEKVRLGDVCYSVSVTHKLSGHQIITINTSDVLNGNVLNHSYVPNDDLRGQFKKSFCENDILYSEIRPQNRRFAYVDFDASDYVASTKLMVVRAKQTIDPRFLYLLLSSDSIISQLQSIAETRSGTFPQITFSELSNLEIFLPSLPTQQHIARILGSLDDKIELNRQLNDNLEQQAQAIFKSWFVDFEPFRDGGLVESELGMIPKGWRVGSLLDIAEYLNGLAMQKYRPSISEKGIHVLKIKELRQGLCDESSELCSETIKSDFVVNDGDVIFSWSGSLMVDIWCGGVCGLNQHLFKVTSSKFDKWFYYLWTLTHLQNFIRIANDKAVTMGHIKREDLEKSLVLIPDASTYGVMDSLMTPAFKAVIANKIENVRLASLRDTLLPKLMSGELSVENTEREVTPLNYHLADD